MGETASGDFSGNDVASVPSGQIAIQREIAIRAKIHQRHIATAKDQARREPAARVSGAR